MDNWSLLLTIYEQGERYVRQPAEYSVPVMSGDIVRTEWAITIDRGVFEIMTLVVNVRKTANVSAFILLIVNGVAHIGIEEAYGIEQYFTKLPDVWQLYGAEDYDSISLSLRRSEEVLVML